MIGLGPLGAAGVSLTASLFAAACRPAPAVVPHERAPAPAAVASSRPEASQSAPPAAPQATPPKPVAAAGSTRGTVACGAARCKLPGEICVLLDPTGPDQAPSRQCVPRARAADSDQRYACDDASDCADGQACCLGFESAFVGYACSPRSGAQANCALESCVADGGAPCPTGQVCAAGVCGPADARATCNGGQRCPASAPICVWAKGVATCASEPTTVDSGASSPDQLRMSCASHEDCGAGLLCCTNAIGNATSCRVSCDLANNVQLCQRDADCPSEGSAKLRCLPTSAKRSGRFPPWVRVCGER